MCTWGACTRPAVHVCHALHSVPGQATSAGAPTETPWTEAAEDCSGTNRA